MRVSLCLSIQLGHFYLIPSFTNLAQYGYYKAFHQQSPQKFGILLVLTDPIFKNISLYIHYRPKN